VRVADLLAPPANRPENRPENRPRDLLAVANALEGHPDNAAAALLGGLTVAWCDEPSDGSPCPVHAVRLSPHPSIEPVLLVPEKRLDTRLARAVLPSLVPHADAARTAGRAALLVHAMTADPSLLLPATQDWLHQEPRAAAMPETLALVRELRAQGHPAVVSGAGPGVLVLCVGDEEGGLGAQVDAVTGSAPPGWTTLAVGVAHQGTRGGVRR
jgi:homoserine kinase